jgi:hypothetical protein
MFVYCIYKITSIIIGFQAIMLSFVRGILELVVLKSWAASVRTEFLHRECARCAWAHPNMSKTSAICYFVSHFVNFIFIVECGCEFQKSFI